MCRVREREESVMAPRFFGLGTRKLQSCHLQLLTEIEEERLGAGGGEE